MKTPLKSHFPPDEPATRKNPLYVKLFDGFDRADGKLTESERKVKREFLKQYLVNNCLSVEVFNNFFATAC